MNICQFVRDKLHEELSLGKLSGSSLLHMMVTFYTDYQLIVCLFYLFFVLNHVFCAVLLYIHFAFIVLYICFNVLFLFLCSFFMLIH